jgi:hypothetical protein
MGSGFLADQLHWPICKSLTPTLCFGFAVDGGGCELENPFVRIRSIPKKCHCGLAGKEGPIPDTGDAIRDRDARQAGAFAEGPTPDAGDSLAFDSRRDS